MVSFECLLIDKIFFSFSHFKFITFLCHLIKGGNKSDFIVDNSLII